MGDHAQDATAEFHTTYNDVVSDSRLVQIIHEADSWSSKI
jgi:hypothetical protein